MYRIKFGNGKYFYHHSYQNLRNNGSAIVYKATTTYSRDLAYEFTHNYSLTQSLIRIAEYEPELILGTVIDVGGETIPMLEYYKDTPDLVNILNFMSPIDIVEWRKQMGSAIYQNA